MHPQSFFISPIPWLKLSWLIAPFVLLMPFEIKLRPLENIFIIVITAICLVCFLSACISFLQGGRFKTFTSLAKVVNSHPHYIALWVNLSIWILFNRLKSNVKNVRIWTHVAFLFFFLFLLTSRNAIFSLYIILICSGYMVIRKKFSLIKVLSMITAFLFLGIALISSIRLNRVRIKNLPRKLFVHDDSAKKDSRWKIYSSAIYTIKEKPIIGYGYSNLQSELNRSYLSLGYNELKEKHLNAHNQYLQELLNGGLVGFILFSIVILFSLKIALHNPIHLGLLFFILMAMLTESIFERAEGLLVFSLMNSFYLKKYFDGWKRKS